MRKTTRTYKKVILYCTPFDSQGGKGRMYQLFGDKMTEIINELNDVLAA